MNPVLISDTGPIIALSGVNQLDLLSRLYVRTLVPDSVDKEVKGCIHNRLGLENYLRTNWIEVVEPVEVEPLLRTELFSTFCRYVIAALLGREKNKNLFVDSDGKWRTGRHG